MLLLSALPLLPLLVLPHSASAAIVRRAGRVPSHVSLSAAASSDQTIVLHVSLALSDPDGIEAALRNVSDPSSEAYGQYLSAADVRSQFGPADDDVAAVTDWLKSEGVDSVSAGPDCWTISFATTVERANSILDAEFAYYDVGDHVKLRTMRYSVPDAVHRKIAVISPTTNFGSATKPTRPLMLAAGKAAGAAESKADVSTSSQPAQPQPSDVPFDPSSCQASITPDCLDVLYDFAYYQPDQAASGSRVGFASFLNQSASRSDFDLFVSQYGNGSDVTSESALQTVLINGGIDDQSPTAQTVEANLDAQMIQAVVRNLTITQFITGGSPPFVPNVLIPDNSSNTNEPYLQFYQYLLEQGNDDIPQVISLSYGDEEETVPLDYAQHTCNMAALMGLRGISVLHSSGDFGIGASCISNDGQNRTEFTPIFPASCPYVTTVGGTMDFEIEAAWDGSSGGFSNIFPRAWYQQDAVEAYLKDQIDPSTLLYYQGFTNVSGRAFPDLAAHSFSPPLQVVDKGAPSFAGGTSAAAPLVAGMVGLLNDARLRAGLPTMGFLNPWLYKLASAENQTGLEDIVVGGSAGCTGINGQTGAPIPGGGVISYAAWNATAGWDPVTGLGVPLLRGLEKVAVPPGLGEQL